MIIRHGKESEIDELMKIYDRAKVFMHTHGNPSQWADGYPSRAQIMQDICQKRLFVCTQTEDSEIEAVFVYITDKEPTYSAIENGQWLNNEQYGTIHRVASAGRISGISDICMRWCLEKLPNMRGDTHKDNIFMQRAFERNGFVKCGTIYVRDGSPRIAYQYAGN